MTEQAQRAALKAVDDVVSDHVQRLIATAHAAGWYVLGLRMEKPCSITVGDRFGTRITIEDDYCLAQLGYLEQLTPFDRHRAAPDDGASGPR